MEQREKLIELLIEADMQLKYPSEEACECCDLHDVGRCDMVHMADHLLANGVVVLPCRCRHTEKNSVTELQTLGGLTMYDISILKNTIESMASDADDKGEKDFAIRLTVEDAFALCRLEPVVKCRDCVFKSKEPCVGGTYDACTNDCNEGIDGCYAKIVSDDWFCAGGKRKGGDE